MKKVGIFLILILILGGFFISPPKVLASHCWLGFIGVNCSHEPSPPPPPPPSPPTLTLHCDGKYPKAMALIRDITCKDTNAITIEQLVTISGINFPPGVRMSLLDLQLQTLDGKNMGILPMHPYPDGKTVLEAGSDGALIFIVETPIRSLRKEDNYFVQPGNYRLSLRFKTGSQAYREVVTPITIVAPKKEAPPQPPPTPPTPKPEPPKPPPLPSGGNCDISFPENKFHVCFFDGISAPTTASPTLAQRDQMSFSSPVGSSQGFKIDWGMGIVGGSGKSDKVSAIWRGRLNFKEGTYNFHTKSDDGIELKLDGATVLSNWSDHPPVQNDLNNISGGLRDIELRWYENGLGAVVEFWWDWTPPSPKSTPTPEPPKSEPKPEPKPEPTPVEPEMKYSIVIEPTRAKPGESFKIVSWKGFGNNTKVNVYIDNQKLKSVYLSKSDLPELILPQNILNGKHTIKVEDTVWFGLADSHIAETSIEIYGGKDEIEPTLTADKQIILAGDSVILRGENWQDGEKKIVLFDIDGKEFSLGEVKDLCNKTIAGYWCNRGELKFSVAVPENTVAGTYFLGVLGAGGQKASIAVKILSSKKVIAEKPSIILNPVSGKAGTAVVVSGGGFEKKTGLLAKFDTEKLALGKGAGFYADDSGSFSTIIYIPLAAKPGKHSITFLTGLAGGSASAEFVVLGAEEEKPKDKPTEKPVEKLIEKPTEVEIKKYDDTATKNFGDIKTNSYGDLTAPSFGDIKTTEYGDIKTNSYGDITAPSFGEVKAPTYEEPKVLPGECNPLIPSFSQPGCSSVFGFFKNFFKNIFRSEPKLKSNDIEKSNELEKFNELPTPSLPITPKKTETKKQENQPEVKKQFDGSKYAGSYRCWSYNVSGGGGGNCRLFAPLILRADGTYSLSSEVGTFRVEGDAINLSESKIRGTGKLLEGGMQIRFEYDYNGWHHTLTYLKEGGVLPKTDEPEATAKTIEVTIRIIFPQGDYSADSVNTMTLFEKGTKNQIGQSLAYPIDRQTIEAWFSKRPPKEGVMTGKVYDIFVSSGFDEWKVGELDVTKATADFTATINSSTQY